MEEFIISESDLFVEITGPALSYELSYAAEFTSSTEMKVAVKTIDMVFGNKNEDLIITLNSSKFISKSGIPIYNNTVSGHPYQIVGNEELLNRVQTATSSTLQTTMAFILSTNILL